jgi:hypothetical protein
LYESCWILFGLPRGKNRPPKLDTPNFKTLCKHQNWYINLKIVPKCPQIHFSFLPTWTCCWCHDTKYHLKQISQIHDRSFGSQNSNFGTKKFHLRLWIRVWISLSVQGFKIYRCHTLLQRCIHSVGERLWCLIH